MLKKLNLNNFTVFDYADISFSSGLNVIVGENGTGKTHLLKVGYLLCKALDQAVFEDPNQRRPNKSSMEQFLAVRLIDCFKPDSLGGLARQGAKKTGRTVISCDMEPSGILVSPDNNGKYEPPLNTLGKWKFSFSATSSRKVSIETYLPNQQNIMPVYHPAKEIISFMEGLVGLYKKREVAFDETIYDLAVNLDPVAFRLEPDLLNEQMDSLVELIGGRLEKEGGKFYVVKNPKEKREISLVAEGLRKLATLQRLISVGSLQRGATLFWDEPESNLNPRLIRIIAQALWDLSQSGVQVIIATHSYFLLKEFDLLSKSGNSPSVDRYFGLRWKNNSVTFEQADSIYGLEYILSLEEELSQYDREQSLHYQNGERK